MATDFDSFNSSTLGAFIQSALAARGDAGLGVWFYVKQGGLDIWKSPDGLTFTLDISGTFDGCVSLVGDRLFTNHVYSDPPYSSTVAFTGETSQGIWEDIIEADDGSLLALCLVSFGSGSSPDIKHVYRSTDGGDTWASVTHANSAGGDVFNSVYSNIIKLSTGRLICTVGASLTFAWGMWSDDNGATWTGGTAYSLRQDHWLFENNLRELVLIRAFSGTTAEVWKSTDDGSTWTNTGWSVPFNTDGTTNSIGASKFLAGRTDGTFYFFTDKGSTPKYLMKITNDGASSSDFAIVADYGVGLMGPDGTIYCVNASDDKLYSSTDGTTFDLVSTSPSSLDWWARKASRVSAVGMVNSTIVEVV